MEQTYQLAIIGGGMQGAALLWEATHRGIKTVLIERGDYAAGTTANSLRVVHGGLRHLQRADIANCLKMIREQRVLMQIAPALVQPLLCAMPTAASGMRSAPIMATGLWLYDRLRDLEAIAARSAVNLPASGLRAAATLDPATELRPLPVIANACWYDAQTRHAERLALAFVNSSRAQGGDTLNYRAVTAVERRNADFELTATDTLSGESTQIRAQAVVDCSSDWLFFQKVHQQLNQKVHHAPHPQPSPQRYVKAVNLVLGTTSSTVARALYINNATVNNRLLFLTPWRQRLVIGTWYFPIHDRPIHDRPIHDRAVAARLTRQELNTCLEDINSVAAHTLTAADVAHAQVGYLPVTDALSASAIADPAAYLVKNGSTDPLRGYDGYYVAKATKFTMARQLAEQCIDRVSAETGLQATASRSRILPLQQQFDQRLFATDSQLRYRELLEPSARELPAAVIADAEYAINHEQVVTLADLVRRRLPLGDVCPPPTAVTQALLVLLAARHSWSETRQSQELQRLAAEYPLNELTP